MRQYDINKVSCWRAISSTRSAKEGPALWHNQKLFISEWNKIDLSPTKSQNMIWIRIFDGEQESPISEDGTEQLGAASSLLPARHHKSPLPTHHLWVVEGQFTTANSLQGQHSMGSWRENWAGRQAGGWVGRMWELPIFTHTRRHHCYTELWAIQNSGHLAAAGRQQQQLGVSHFHIRQQRQGIWKWGTSATATSLPPVLPTAEWPEHRHCHPTARTVNSPELGRPAAAAAAEGDVKMGSPWPLPPSLFGTFAYPPGSPVATWWWQAGHTKLS